MGNNSRLVPIAAAALAAFLHTAAVSAPVSGQGDWETYFVGRDANGNAVPMVVGGAPNPSLTFVYDTQYNLTWLADWNVKGPTIHPAAVGWADTLSFTVSGREVAGWRLPRVVDTGFPGCDLATGGTDCGYNVQAAKDGQLYSEFAVMWYTRLGNLGYAAAGSSFAADGSVVPQPNWGLSNTGPFSSMQLYEYWTGTLYPPETSAPRAWTFDLEYGFQFAYPALEALYAVAVRDGDILAGAVPGPATLSMLLMGLGIVVLASTRRAHRPCATRRAIAMAPPMLKVAVLTCPRSFGPWIPGKWLGLGSGAGLDAAG